MTDLKKNRYNKCSGIRLHFFCNRAAETGSKKTGNQIIQKFPEFKVALTVWEHFSQSPQWRGVMSYKISKALEMSFHLIHSNFAVLSRWGVIRTLVRKSEARIRCRSFSHILACNFVSASWRILIMKTSKNSRCWAKWAGLISPNNDYFYSFSLSESFNLLKQSCMPKCVKNYDNVFWLPIFWRES